MAANVLYIKSVICLYMWPHGTRKNKMANVEEQKKKDVLRADQNEVVNILLLFVIRLSL